VQAGYVWVNNASRHFIGAPFGGYKQSGIGRDFGPGALAPYTETKSVCVAY
jgi:acyl-CoA reductase-like NAD-dependent aldehyde dehydrogenase